VSLEFFIDIKSFRSQYGPGVNSASNRNEHQEYILMPPLFHNLNQIKSSHLHTICLVKSLWWDVQL